MSYNPHQSKPYVFMQNTDASIVLDGANGLPTRVEDYPLDLDEKFTIDLNNGAGDLNTSTYEFVFGTNTFLFGDTFLINNKQNRNHRAATSFTVSNGDQVGVRGQDRGLSAHLTDDWGTTGVTSPRTNQRSDEMARLMGEPNKPYSYRFATLQHGFNSSTWASNLLYGSPSKTTVVFGLVL